MYKQYIELLITLSRELHEGDCIQCKVCLIKHIKKINIVHENNEKFQTVNVIYPDTGSWTMQG